MLNDLFVLTKIKEGDVKAFEGIFRLYYSPLCLYAAGITGSMDVAEEIVQELFYVFWKEKEKLQVFRFPEKLFVRGRAQPVSPILRTSGGAQPLPGKRIVR